VRIRSRKPWVLDRRRLFGWNVRLLTRYSYDTTSVVVHPPAGGCTRGAGGVVGHHRQGPRKLVSRGPAAPAVAHPGGVPTGQDPSTDSDQHSRGILPSGRPVGHRLPSLHQDGDAGCAARRSGRPTTRPGRRPDRCRAVDGAVSVAVAPRRASGFRRAGRPVGIPDRRTTVPRPQQGSDQRGCTAGQRARARGSVCRRQCTPCGHWCGTSTSGHPHRDLSQGPPSMRIRSEARLGRATVDAAIVRTATGDPARTPDETGRGVSELGRTPA
jgi:hypothetical protein